MSEKRTTAPRRQPSGGSVHRTQSAQTGTRRPAGAGNRVQSADVRRRRMTPEQRKRAMQRRRMRKLKQNLKFIIPAIIVLVIAIILIIVSGGSGKKDNIVTSNVQEQPQVQAGNDAVSTADTMPVIESENNTDATDIPAADTESTDVSSMQVQEVQAVPAQSAPAIDWATGYDLAYIKAIKGEVSGPDLQIKTDGIDKSMYKRWSAPDEGHLPILYKAQNVDEKLICVTVDDCYQGENLRKIVQCALDNNGKLTIFPIGANVAKSNIGSVVKWAWENGMELENHTYNHCGLYHFDDERMAQEFWYQNCELNELLGVNYTEHFFRPHGGDERNDQRVHAYIQQLGFYGLAMWSDDGSKSAIKTLKKQLAPGKIYLFHTTDTDWKLLKEFIPYAASQGYRMVTMNEMFGLPENETSALTMTKSTQPPAAQPFKVLVPTLKKPTYMRAVSVIQTQLNALGWLAAEPSGYYGDETAAAVKEFQQASGIEADGMAGLTTQAALFADTARHK